MRYMDDMRFSKSIWLMIMFRNTWIDMSHILVVGAVAVGKSTKWWVYS